MVNGRYSDQTTAWWGYDEAIRIAVFSPNTDATCIETGKLAPGLYLLRVCAQGLLMPNGVNVTWLVLFSSHKAKLGG